MHRVARPIDHELFEVPGDVGRVGIAGLSRPKQPVQLAGTIPVDFDLREHRKVDVVLRRDELEDFGFGSWLLRPELVARKPEHLNVVELMMQRTQTCVLRGEASSAGDVDNHEHLIPELAEVDLFAGDARHLEIVDR